MPILDFLSVLKRIAPVRLYLQDPSRNEDLDCAEGVLSFYADKYAYTPKKAQLSKTKDDRPRLERVKAVMRIREVEYESVVDLEAQLIDEKTLCLTVTTREGGTDRFTGLAAQMKPAEEILRSHMRAVAPEPADAPPASTAQSAPQVRADSPVNKRLGAMAGLKIPLINVGAQEKLCKFCETSYPAKALYCPNCGAFETKKAAFGRK